jgi:hypothetical protein
MKIEVRRRPGDSRSARITVREKTIYVCKQCGNRYYSYHFFCPQCLGHVASSAKQSSLLRITSCSAEEAPEVQALLGKLSGMEDFNWGSKLKNLPWLCMKESDPAILRIWKESLEVLGTGVELLNSIPPSKRKRLREQPPLFARDAPYPQFLPAVLTMEIRTIAGNLPTPSLRLHWGETAALAMNLLERIHRKQSERVLFVDFVYEIEESLREFTSRFSTPKISETAFEKQNARLAAALHRMESEMDAVREQIQNQL